MSDLKKIGALHQYPLATGILRPLADSLATKPCDALATARSDGPFRRGVCLRQKPCDAPCDKLATKPCDEPCDEPSQSGAGLGAHFGGWVDQSLATALRRNKNDQKRTQTPCNPIMRLIFK